MFKARMTLKMPRDPPNHSKPRMTRMMPRTPRISTPQTQVNNLDSGERNEPVPTEATLKTLD